MQDFTHTFVLLFTVIGFLAIVLISLSLLYSFYKEKILELILWLLANFMIITSVYALPVRAEFDFIIYAIWMFMMVIFVHSFLEYNKYSLKNVFKNPLNIIYLLIPTFFIIIEINNYLYYSNYNNFTAQILVALAFFVCSVIFFRVAFMKKFAPIFVMQSIIPLYISFYCFIVALIPFSEEGYGWITVAIAIPLFLMTYIFFFFTTLAYIKYLYKLYRDRKTKNSQKNKNNSIRN